MAKMNEKFLARGEFHIRFYPDTLIRTSGGAITAFIYWQFGDFCFPSPRWSDFVVVVPAWWIQAVRSLDGKVTLRFMDGPFFMNLIQVEDGWGLIECYEDRKRKKLLGKYRVQIDDIKRELETVASTVVIEIQERNWRSRYLTDLVKLLRNPWAL